MPTPISRLTDYALEREHCSPVLAIIAFLVVLILGSIVVLIVGLMQKGVDAELNKAITPQVTPYVPERVPAPWRSTWERVAPE